MNFYDYFFFVYHRSLRRLFVQIVPCTRVLWRIISFFTQSTEQKSAQTKWFTILKHVEIVNLKGG